MKTEDIYSITEAINWLKNPCIIDEYKIEKAIESLRQIKSIKEYYNGMYKE